MLRLYNNDILNFILNKGQGGSSTSYVSNGIRWTYGQGYNASGSIVQSDSYALSEPFAVDSADWYIECSITDATTASIKGIQFNSSDQWVYTGSVGSNKQPGTTYYRLQAQLKNTSATFDKAAMDARTIGHKTRWQSEGIKYQPGYYYSATPTKQARAYGIISERTDLEEGMVGVSFYLNNPTSLPKKLSVVWFNSNTALVRKEFDVEDGAYYFTTYAPANANKFTLQIRRDDDETLTKQDLLSYHAICSQVEYYEDWTYTIWIKNEDDDTKLDMYDMIDVWSDHVGMSFASGTLGTCTVEWYDTSREFISSETITGLSTTTEMSLEPVDGASYVKFSLTNSDGTSWNGTKFEAAEINTFF